MKALGTNGMKFLKILHILFGFMWIGGVMALVSIMLGSQPQGTQWPVLESYLVHARCILMDTETGYLSQYLAVSGIVSL